MLRSAAVAVLLLLCVPASGQLLRESALEMGIDHYTLDPQSMAGGVALLDYNRDGHLDIYLTGGLAPDRLYENRGDGSFREVTREMGITAFNITKTMGVVSGDLNDDGYPDLFITTATGAPCHLLLNEGGRRFRDGSRAAGITHEAWSSSASLADYDGDGDLDVYVGNYLTFDAEPFERHITAPEADFLYRNDGDGRFTLVPTPTGADGAGCTLATLFTDYDRDGRQDLFVLNDFGDFYEPNHLLRGGGETETWEEVSKAAGVHAAINAMGITTGDWNADGYPDYFVTNIGDNYLYLGGAKGTFHQAANEWGVNDGTGMSWGTVAQDFDNDGNLDLYVNKGFLGSAPYAQFNRLYLGRQSGTGFADVSRELAVAGVANKARGVAWGDLNNDGRPDLVVAGVRTQEGHTARALVYLSTPGPQNWVSFHPAVAGSGTVAAGTRLVLYAGGRRQERELVVGDSYLSSSEPTAHFGLGSATSIDSVLTYWPDGRIQHLDVSGVNKKYSIGPDHPVRLIQLETKAVCEAGDLSPPELRESTAGGPDTVLLFRSAISTPADCPGAGPAATGYVAYPVPARHTVSLRPNGGVSEEVTVTLFDFNGRRVLKRTFPPGENTTLTIAGLGHLPRGTYLLRWASTFGAGTSKVLLH